MVEWRYLDTFQNLLVGISPCGRIGLLQLARPVKSNAFSAEMWDDFPKAVQRLEREDGLHVILLTAQGKNFCAGIDTSFLAQTFARASSTEGCQARSREQLRQGILAMQEAFSCLEKSPRPVIAAIQGACVGAGVDLITACDLRYCSSDAWFSVKEIDLAMAADLGTLQRLPHIVGHGMAAELALTARSVKADEAERLGLVSRCFGSVEELQRAALEVARQLAGKSQLALVGTKKMLLHARSHSVEEGLQQVALWNSSMLLSEDMARQMQRPRQGRASAVSKL